MKSFLNKLFSLSLFFLFGYPIFYFVYKFGDVRINGLNDYLSYYKLYKDFAIFEIDQAYLPRLFSSYLVYALNKFGWYYDVVIAQQLEGYDQSVYFNAILVNFLGAIGTGFVLHKIAFDHTKNFLVSHIPGILYFLSYGLIAWGAYALVDGFAVFLFVLAFYFYTKRSYWVFLVLFISIFQRDLILVSLGALAFIDILLVYTKQKRINRFLSFVFIWSLACFITMFILRLTIFKTFTIYAVPASEYLQIFNQPRYSHGTFFRAIFFSQNLLLFYLITSIWFKVNHGVYLNNRNLTRILFVFGVIAIMSIIIKVPLEIGRYSSIFSPLIPLFLTLDLFNQRKVKSSNQLT